MACQSTHWADGVWVALTQRRRGTEAKLRATKTGHLICGHICDKLSPEKKYQSAQALLVQFFRGFGQSYFLVKLKGVLRNDHFSFLSSLLEKMGVIIAPLLLQITAI